MQTEYISNEKIYFDSFVLIADDGENLGKKSRQEALEIASSKGLDVVIVNTNEKNPVCKIMDLKKKIYDDKMKWKSNKSSHKKQKAKEIRFTAYTDPHDINTKSKNINKFLKNGFRVKINVRFPVRQKITISNAIEKLINLIFEHLDNDLEYEIGEGSYFGRNNYIMEIVPKSA